MEPIDDKSLTFMRAHVVEGSEWYAYQNADLGHPDRGRLTFLQCGPESTNKTPPKHAPDSRSIGLGWRYLPVGTVDLATGTVVPLPKPNKIANA